MNKITLFHAFRTSAGRRSAVSQEGRTYPAPFNTGGSRTKTKVLATSLLTLAALFSVRVYAPGEPRKFMELVKMEKISDFAQYFEEQFKTKNLEEQIKMMELIYNNKKFDANKIKWGDKIWEVENQSKINNSNIPLLMPLLIPEGNRIEKIFWKNIGTSDTPEARAARKTYAAFATKVLADPVTYKDFLPGLKASIVAVKDADSFALWKMVKNLDAKKISETDRTELNKSLLETLNGPFLSKYAKEIRPLIDGKDAEILSKSENAGDTREDFAAIAAAKTKTSGLRENFAGQKKLAKKLTDGLKLLQEYTKSYLKEKTGTEEEKVKAEKAAGEVAKELDLLKQEEPWKKAINQARSEQNQAFSALADIVEAQLKVTQEAAKGYASESGAERSSGYQNAKTALAKKILTRLKTATAQEEKNFLNNLYEDLGIEYYGIERVKKELGALRAKTTELTQVEKETKKKLEERKRQLGAQQETLLDLENLLVTTIDPKTNIRDVNVKEGVTFESVLKTYENISAQDLTGLTDRQKSWLHQGLLKLGDVKKATLQESAALKAINSFYEAISIPSKTEEIRALYTEAEKDTAKALDSNEDLEKAALLTAIRDNIRSIAVKYIDDPVSYELKDALERAIASKSDKEVLDFLNITKNLSDLAKSLKNKELLTGLTERQIENRLRILAEEIKIDILARQYLQMPDYKNDLEKTVAEVKLQAGIGRKGDPASMSMLANIFTEDVIRKMVDRRIEKPAEKFDSLMEAEFLKIFWPI